LEGGENLKGLRAIVMAFSMYSRLPMPRVEWTEESRAWALCAFPLVGAAVGAALFLWHLLCLWLHVGIILKGIGFTLIPIAITGGIHMDGFCDTCDALASHQSREKKLEILSDPHVGAFAVLGCLMYLLLTVGLWCQLEMNSRNVVTAVCLVPIFSRILSAYAAITQPNARGTGLLADFTQGEAKPRRRLLALCGVVVFLALAGTGIGLSCCLGALLMYGWYLRLAKREFGGLTGDLAGWFLQLCELSTLAMLVLTQRLTEVL
jgi:adenosylcobinamide-GDP ribazoletransferase